MLRNVLGLVLGLVLVPLQGAAASDNVLGPMADVLRARIGTWKVAMTFRPGPDAPASVSEAIQVNRLIGGRWLLSELDAQKGAVPFSGVGLNGYDPARGVYVGTWCDSLSSRITPVEGRYDPASGILTTTSQEQTAHGIRMVTTSTRMIDANDEETSIEAVDPDGRRFTEFAMHLTRQ